jgi:phosphoribosylanthranilate isomerase
MRVKICGLTRAEDVEAASEAGAAYLGFVFFPPSPRSLAPDAARALMLAAPPGIVKVALAVDPDDALIETLAGLPLDMVQLHGHEPPARVRAVRATLGLPVMKAVGVRTAADLAAIEVYGGIADQLLIDAKPPEGATRPGGNALAFDWRLVGGRRWPCPWHSPPAASGPHPRSRPRHRSCPAASSTRPARRRARRSPHSSRATTRPSPSWRRRRSLARRALPKRSRGSMRRADGRSAPARNAGPMCPPMRASPNSASTRRSSVKRAQAG